MDTVTLESNLHGLLEANPGDGAKVFLGASIPEDKLRNARSAHGYFDDVFFLYDATVFGSAKKSILIGRSGLSVKLEDDQPVLRLGWEDVDGIGGSGPTLAVQAQGCLFLLNLGYTSMSVEAIGEGEFLNVLQSFAAVSASPWSQEVETIETTVTAWEAAVGSRPQDTAAAALLGNLHQKLTALLLRPDAHKEGLISRTVLANGAVVRVPSEYAWLAVLHARALIASGRSEGMEELRRVTVALREVLQAPDELSSWTHTFYRPAMAHALHHLARQSEAPDSKLLLYRLSVSEAAENLREVALRGLHELDLAAGFARLRPESRDLLLCTTLLPSWPVAEFRCASPDVLRQLPWKFPVGHPLEGEFYARHPLRSDLYLLIENYHQQLFQDRFGELKDLLAALGAAEIEIEATEGLGRQMLSAYQSELSGSDSVVTGAAASSGTSESEQTRTANIRTVRYRMRLSPSRAPHLPNDLVWFPHEPTWQRVASTALSGACKELSVEFRMSDEYAVSRKRLERVRGELSLFDGKVEVSFQKESERFLQELRQTAWRVTACFQPLAAGTAMPPVHPVAPTLDAAAEYALDVGDVCIDGSLSELARRILTRRRHRFGLTVEQAEAIEEQVLAAWRLTDAEREYFDELEDCWADGVLSEDEHRVLARRRAKLGISEARAAELEKRVRKGGSTQRE